MDRVIVIDDYEDFSDFLGTRTAENKDIFTGMSDSRQGLDWIYLPLSNTTRYYK